MDGLSSSGIVNSLRNFWAVVVEVWSYGVLGVPIGHLLAAALVLIAFLVVRKLFTRWVIVRLRESALRAKLRLPKEAVDALQGPVGFIPVVMGVFFALELAAPEGEAAVMAGRLVRSLVAVVIFWGLYNLVGPLKFLLARLERVLTTAMVEWLVKAIRVAIAFIGAATVLEIWGIQIGPVLAGLGLIGVAVALGAQDLFKNLIGGILILVEKRFSYGDWVRIEGVVEGNVESIGFRSTVIRRFDKAPVFVPNARFADSPVINFTQMTYRRIYWKIGVVYGTTVGQLRTIRDSIEAYLHEHDDRFASPSEAATFVRIDSFNDSSIDIMVYCFTRTTNWGEWLKIKEDLAYHIKDVVEGAGSAFAFPSRSIYIESPTGEVPEAFVPPGSGRGEPAAAKP